MSRRDQSWRRTVFHAPIPRAQPELEQAAYSGTRIHDTRIVSNEYDARLDRDDILIMTERSARDPLCAREQRVTDAERAVRKLRERVELISNVDEDDAAIEASKLHKWWGRPTVRIRSLVYS